MLLLSGSVACTNDEQNDISCALGGEGCPDQTKIDSAMLEASRPCFTAAVLEYARQDLPDIKETSKVNLANFRLAAKMASEHGSQIVVFPEDGIFYAKTAQLGPFLREIPDPDKLDPTNNNPCIHDYKSQTNWILKELSCMAKDFNIYIVANFGTRENCDPGKPIGEEICPEEGFLKMNTNVVLDNEGNFIKRYRKWNLYIEPFVKPPTMELAYFDSPYGRFGLFTCFDMIFKSPAIDLVEKYQVDTMIFPTFWFDELPILSAVQYQDGWSLRNKVNLLASNILYPSLGSGGSGIYTGQDTFYTGPNTTRNSLIIADIPKYPKQQVKCPQKIHKVEVGLDERNVEYKHSNYKLLDTDILVILDKEEGNERVCSDDFCCQIDYKLNGPLTEESRRRLILIVRNSLRAGSFNWFEQVCFLATTEQPVEDKIEVSTIQFNTEGLVAFDKLSLNGGFQTDYVYPIAAYRASQIVSRNLRDFSCNKSEDNSSSCQFSYKGKLEDGKLSSFGMYGRVYEKDKLN